MQAPMEQDTMDSAEELMPEDNGGGETAAEPAPAGRRLRLGEVLRLALVVGFIVAALWGLRQTEWGHRLTSGKLEDLRAWMGAMRAWIDQWGAWSWAIFTLVASGLMSVGVPRLALAVAAGVMFGALEGTALAQLASTLSAVPAYYYTQFMGRAVIERRMGPRLRQIDALLGEHGFLVMLLIRVCPVGNAFLTNCLAGMSAIPFRTYLTASFIGFLPQNFIFALGGSSLSGPHFKSLITLSLALQVTFTLAILWFFRRSPLAKRVLAVMRGLLKRG